ncbi:hypothetical protein BGW80DRAFT_856953 [Lactifluus volemus]|nr:hypothetical protein BGW80DRAFT_856953 [Lactifluus volemus]
MIQNIDPPVGMNRLTSSPARSGGGVSSRQPTAEELIAARRWIEEQKRILVTDRNFDGTAGHSPIRNEDIQDHIAYATLKNADIVRSLFNMMAATKFQVKEMRNPHPRCALDIHTIRGMIQEADNMDKGLQTILGLRVQPSMMPPSISPSSQPPRQTAYSRTSVSFVPSGSRTQPGFTSTPFPETWRSGWEGPER